MQKEYIEISNESISDKLVKVFPFLKKLFEIFPWLEQFINFGIVGVSNTVIAYVVYAVLVYYNLHPQIANAISFIASVLNAYIWNKIWVFGESSKKKVATPFKFMVVYGGNYLLGVFLLYLYIDVLYLNKYIAPFISLPVTVPLNFLLNRFWVFKNNE